jgi:NTE family protein
MTERPDVLVLGGGGILGETWMLAVLTGYEEETGVDLRECDLFVGTSAGSIVAATLAAGRTPASRLGDMPAPEGTAAAAEPDAASTTGALVGGVLSAGRAAVGAVAPLALRSTEFGGSLVRRAALARVPEGRMSLDRLGRAVAASGVGFDGRLQVAAVDVDNGRRVMFGAPGAPPASVADAVMASCAIPGVFRPVTIDGRTYVDGGAWSPTNLDAVDARRGMRVLCLNPTGSLRPTRETPMGAVGPLSRGVAGVEALALERRGATVETVSPDAASSTALGTNFMASGPRARVAAAGLAQGRALVAKA